MIKKLDGNELLYPFFKSWLEKEQDTAQEFIKKAIDALGNEGTPVSVSFQYDKELPHIISMDTFVDGSLMKRFENTAERFIVSVCLYCCIHILY